MAATASLNAAAPPATLQPLASSAVAPLNSPQALDEQDDRFIEILKIILLLLGSSSPEAASSPEQLMTLIDHQYATNGVPPDLTPQQRADGREAIAKARAMLTELAPRLDAALCESFKSTLNQIEADLSQ